VKEVFLLSVKTSDGSITPLAVFSTEEKASAFAEHVPIPNRISRMRVDVWTVVDKEA